MALAADARTGWRELVGPGIATLLSLAILIGLGTWQLERRAWKHDVVARIEARTRAPAVPVEAEAAWPAWTPRDGEYRRVTLEGVYDHAAAVAVHGLAHDQPGRPLQGFHILTPLRRDDGSVVVVDRGFVVPELKDREMGRAARPAGRVTVTGLVRASESRGWFVPENGPGGWFVRDIGAIGRAAGLERVAPFYVDAEAGPDPQAWPRAGRTRLALADNHLQYALTWFGLAAALAVVFVAFARRRLGASGRQLQADDPDQDQRDAAEPHRVG